MKWGLNQQKTPWGWMILLLGMISPISAEAAETQSLETGLVLHLPLNDDLRDHSVAAHPIQVIGDVTIREEGAYFGGRKDWLEGPHIPLNDRAFSIALWIKPTSGDRQIGFVEQFDLNLPGHHFCLQFRENRQPYFSFYGGGLLSPLSVGWDSKWMHLVFQYTGESQEIWINGHFIARLRKDPYQGSSGMTVIGKSARWPNTGLKDFIGLMRDFRIYHRALDAREIALLSAPENASEDEGAQLNSALFQSLPEDPAVPFLTINGKRLEFNGRAGHTYAVAGSSDIQRWAPMTRLTNEVGAVIYFDETEAEKRFYKVFVETEP